MIYLTDDGTMDTVLACDQCAAEFRFNYAESGVDEINAETEYSDTDAESHYQEFVQSCIDEIENEHECDPEIAE